jgi:DNA mismatch endonuclease (patch repair protein)
MTERFADGRPKSSRRRSHPETDATSFAATASARRKMQAQRSRDTSAELAVRRAVHARGLRYRVDQAPIIGFRRRADLVFRSLKLAVYVDGCFWHVCPDHGTWPRTNEEWWRQKLERNQERDRETDRRLADEGWTVLRIWEHESPELAADRVAIAAHGLRQRSERR